MISNTVDRHLIKGVDAFGAYLEYAGFSQEFRREVVDKDAMDGKSKKEIKQIEEM